MSWKRLLRDVLAIKCTGFPGSCRIECTYSFVTLLNGLSFSQFLSRVLVYAMVLWTKRHDGKLLTSKESNNNIPLRQLLASTLFQFPRPTLTSYLAHAGNSKPILMSLLCLSFSL